MVRNYLIICLVSVFLACNTKSEDKFKKDETSSIKTTITNSDGNPKKKSELTLNTIKGFWATFQQAVEKQDRQDILNLIKVRDNIGDSIGISEEEIEGLLNTILNNGIRKKILTTSVYGLKIANWDFGVNFPPEKKVYFVRAIGYIEGVEFGMPDNFGIILFFSEFDGEYRLFHQLYAG